MTTLLGDGGLMVGQVPDLTLLQTLRYLVYLQHMLLLPCWTMVGGRGVGQRFEGGCWDQVRAQQQQCCCCPAGPLWVGVGRLICERRPGTGRPWQEAAVAFPAGPFL